MSISVEDTFKLIAGAVFAPFTSLWGIRALGPELCSNSSQILNAIAHGMCGEDAYKIMNPPVELPKSSLISHGWSNPLSDRHWGAMVYERSELGDELPITRPTRK